MPTVNAVPCKRGMQIEELYGRLQSGWTLLGRQTMQRGKAIATPDNPEGSRLEDADVWVLNEPMIPMGMLAQMMLQAMRGSWKTGDSMGALDALECLCYDVFGMGLIDMQKALVEENANAQGPDTSTDQSR